MFLDDDKIERGVLRQGDVITQIHVFGAITNNNILYLSQQGKPEEIKGWTVHGAPKICDAMVLSHSCEIDPGNAVKLTSIILAPIRDINSAAQKDKIQEVIDSNLIHRDKQEASYLKYFYIPPHPSLQYSSGAIVDFSKCFSLRKNSYDDLVSRKILQLTEEVRINMSLKLSLYFHRTDDKVAA
jgi:hypothetical protein